MKYSAMMLLFWTTLLSIILRPGAADFSAGQCNTTDDSLYIIMDSSSDPDLTFIRITHFFQYFISKRDSSAKTPIYLIEPFQQKVFRCSNVSSDQEIRVYLDQFELSINVNKSSRNGISTLSTALTFTNTILQAHYSMYGEQSIVNAWFSVCYVSCVKTLRLFRDYNFDIDAKQFFLFLPTSVKDSRDAPYWSHFNKFTSYLLDPYDDLSDNNKIALYGCNECPIGWIYFLLDSDTSTFYCYKIDVLPTELNWFEASAHCRRMYSELPTVENDVELQFLIATLSNATNRRPCDQAEQFAVHVGLTKTSIENDVRRWINKRPFTLRNSFPSGSNDNSKCMVLKRSCRARGKDESIRENDDVALELVDCKKNKADIVLCKRSIDLTSNVKAVGTFYLESQALQQTMPLNKEFDLDINFWSLHSVVHRNRVLEPDKKTEYRQLLFDCNDDLNAVVYSKVCNDFIDCDSGRDEAYCGVTNSVEKKDFFCVNPNANEQFPYVQTIPHNLKCNIHQDCPDNSDELGCDECKERRCYDGTCVPRHWLSSDEEKCRLYKNSNGTMFINVTVESFRAPTKQHEVVSCNVFESAYQNTRPNANTETYKWAPKCLFLRGRSGRPIGCNDMSHLQGCMDFTCDEEFTKCHQSYCIPWYLINDGVMDCPHGEDEDKFNAFQFSGIAFICNSNKINYIHPVHVCDGVAHCPHSDDELNCNIMCPPGFKCFGSAVMVNNISEVEEIKSFRIFDIQTKYLKVSGLDLSHLNDLYVLPNLLELHASNCSLESLDYIFGDAYQVSVYNLDLSYNKFTIFTVNNNNFKHLHVLNLTGNIYLSDFFLYLLSPNNLKKLDLSFTNVSTLFDEPRTKRFALRYLNVANTKIESLQALYSDKISPVHFLDIRNACLKESDTVDLLKKLTITTALYVDNFKYCCPQVVGTGIPKHVCHAPFDGISSCEDLIGDILKRSLLWLAALLSLVGNIMVLAFRLYYDREILKKGYGVFVTNLGIADFVMGVYLTIMASMDIYFRDNYVIHETDWRASILCKVSGFLSTLSSESSTFFVLLITLERFLVIRFPFGEYRLTKLFIILLVVTSWTIGFTLALIPILFSQWTIYSSNGMCIGLPLNTDRQQGWQYSFGVFIVFNCICFLVVAFGQVLIFISMSGQRFIVTNFNATRRLQDIDVAKQLFIVALSNFLCWFPICVTGLMSLNGHKVSPESYAWFVIFVLPLNSAINPMIYTIPAIFKKWIEFKGFKHS